MDDTSLGPASHYFALRSRYCSSAGPRLHIDRQPLLAAFSCHYLMLMTDARNSLYYMFPPLLYLMDASAGDMTPIMLLMKYYMILLEA